MVAAMVYEHHHVLHRQARALQLADALQDAAACDQDVVNHNHSVALLKVALDQAPGAMGLHLLAGIDQRLVQLQREPSGGGQGAVGDAGDAVKFEALQLAGIGVEHSVEQVWVGDDLAQIDVVVEDRTRGLYVIAE